MKTTSRDKVLMMFLPALMIVVIYGSFVGMNRQKMVTQLTKAVKAAQEKLPTQAQLATQQVAQALAQRDLNKAKEELKTWDDRWHALVAPCLVHDRRSDRQSKLLKLLLDQNVHVKVHGPMESATDQKTQMKLSHPQERLVKLMSERGGQTPHLWRLQVEGGYPDIRRALFVLSSSSGELVAIPLSLAMDESKTTGGVRSWSILVWI